MIPLEKKKKKKNTKKCREYHSWRLISHDGKILLRGLNTRLQGRVEEHIEEEHLGFRKAKGVCHAIAVIRTIGERDKEKGRDVHVVFIDLEMAFVGVVWDKLLEIWKKLGVNGWRDDWLETCTWTRKLEWE